MYKLGLLLLALTPSFAYSTYYVKNSYTEINATYNSIGQTGLIHLPTGSLQKEGTVGITMGNSSLNKFISVIATPFPWLEASFFYHRPRDTFYLKKDKYLDKGFNLKLGFNYRGIDLAIGIDDIAGTGFLSKEYIAATVHNNNVIVTLGIGTGALAKDHPYKNPISRLRNRPIKELFINPESKVGSWILIPSLEVISAYLEVLNFIQLGFLALLLRLKVTLLTMRVNLDF